MAAGTTGHCVGRIDWPAAGLDGHRISPRVTNRSKYFSCSGVETESWSMGDYLHDREDSIIDVVTTHRNHELSPSEAANSRFSGPSQSTILPLQSCGHCESGTRAR